jgi:hypothetical protein
MKCVRDSHVSFVLEYSKSIWNDRIHLLISLMAGFIVWHEGRCLTYFPEQTTQGVDVFVLSN